MLQTAKVYTVMELENVFWHLPIEEFSHHYSAFITKAGLFYQFYKATFGLATHSRCLIPFANSVFQHVIQEDVMHIVVSDIIIFA